MALAHRRGGALQVGSRDMGRVRQWASLKTLEHALAINVGGEDARSLLGPLVGIYNLRHADAPLPTSDLTAAYALAKVNPAASFVTQGYELLQSCVATLEATAAIIKPAEPRGEAAAKGFTTVWI